MLSKQCPKCGKNDDLQFIGAFCKECFALHHKTYTTEDIEVDICPKCGRIRQGKEWKENVDETVQRAVEKSIKTSYPVHVKVSIGRNAKGFLATTSIALDVEGHVIQALEKIRVPTNPTQCPDCSKKQGGYHEAVIQLRGKNADKLAEKIIMEVEKTSFVTRTMEQKNGVDILVGSKKTALEAVATANKHYVTTNKLVGEKDGKRLLRLTILVRV